MRDVAVVVGALGALLALLVRPRAGLIAGLLALGLAELLLAEELVPGGLASKLASAEGAALVAVGVPVVIALGALLIRFPGVVVPLAVAAAPFRLPFEFGADNRFFVGFGEAGALGRLVPLYGVIGAAAVALAWRALRGEPLRPVPTVLAVPAALFVALTALSLLWAEDPSAATNRIAFFVLPFTALLAIVARAPFRPWLTRVLAAEALALAIVFAAVGLGEAWARELLFYDPKIAVANSYTSYFRVTSLFSDPSIYGRHLAVAIAIVVVALWLGRIGVVLGAGLVAFLWAGLYFSYSQSSMVALAAATVVVTYLAADRRARRVIALVGAALVFLGAAAFVTLVRDESTARVTSGRSTLVSDTWEVFRNHPVAGVGVASQPAASREEAGGARSARRNTSHTAPLTVAAELGFVGFALYVALLAGAVRVLWAVRRRDEALGLGLVAVVAVLFVHSLSYGVFFDDPLLWASLGVASAALVAHERALRAHEPFRAPSPPAPAAAAR